MYSCLLESKIWTKMDNSTRLTVADLKVFVDLRELNSGRVDHVPTDLVEKIAPAVAEYYAKFGAK
jgi:glutathione S-transferase